MVDFRLNFFNENDCKENRHIEMGTVLCAGI